MTRTLGGEDFAEEIILILVQPSIFLLTLLSSFHIPLACSSSSSSRIIQDRVSSIFPFTSATMNTRLVFYPFALPLPERKPRTDKILFASAD